MSRCEHCEITAAEYANKSRGWYCVAHRQSWPCRVAGAHDARLTEIGSVTICARHMTHDDIAEIAFQTINACNAEGIHDSLRQAHAIAVALLFAEADR